VPPNQWLTHSVNSPYQRSANDNDGNGGAREETKLACTLSDKTGDVLLKWLKTESGQMWLLEKSNQKALNMLSGT
jgi:hypothetical protein